ncbi:hypothetical protein I4U23_007416 [Adineta vaga]|nr:hypothetical protein I4U23_007416 [Adineta vaga]
MADIISASKCLIYDNTSKTNSEKSESSSLVSTSPRSLSPTSSGWIAKYKILPKNEVSKGIWDGYKTKEEFMAMHFR